MALRNTKSVVNEIIRKKVENINEWLENNEFMLSQEQENEIIKEVKKRK